MDYATARDQIKTGDAILVKEDQGLLAPFTRFFTRSRYTHAGVAIWIDGGLYMAELNAGRNHLIPLSQLEGIEFDVYHCPAVGDDAIRAAIFEVLRERINYSMPALVLIGANEWLRLGLSPKAQKLLVCSGMVVLIYDKLGWPTVSRIISPQKLSENLKLKLSVQSVVA